jgi:hypothetical protein
MKIKSRLTAVAVFALAMAWVEAAVVLYLRVLVDRIQPYQADPLPRFGGLGEAELIREASTLLMLLAVGWLAGRNVRTRLAFSFLAFGVWDIAYYVFLVPLTGWPRSLLDWDILFLIPVPWWGPVIAPVAVSLLVIAGGLSIILLEERQKPAGFRRWMAAVALAGMGLILYAFTADAFQVAGRGLERIRQELPADFGWNAFLIGYGLMALPVLDLGRRILPVRRKGEVGWDGKKTVRIGNPSPGNAKEGGGGGWVEL